MCYYTTSIAPSHIPSLHYWTRQEFIAKCSEYLFLPTIYKLSADVRRPNISLTVEIFLWKWTTPQFFTRVVDWSEGLTCSEAGPEDVPPRAGESAGGGGGQPLLRGPGWPAQAYDPLEEGRLQDADRRAGGWERGDPGGGGEERGPGDLPVCGPGPVWSPAGH